MITAVELCAHSFRLVRIQDGFIEIDNTVESFPAADPGVDSFALCFFFRRVITRKNCSFERSQGAAVIWFAFSWALSASCCRPAIKSWAVTVWDMGADVPACPRSLMPSSTMTYLIPG